MGRVGRAAIKVLYARQHEWGNPRNLTDALRAALWAILDMVKNARPRTLHMGANKGSSPIVYAGAYVKVGEKKWWLADEGDWQACWVACSFAGGPAGRPL